MTRIAMLTPSQTILTARRERGCQTLALFCVLGAGGCMAPVWAQPPSQEYEKPKPIVIPNTVIAIPVAPVLTLKPAGGAPKVKAGEYSAAAPLQGFDAGAVAKTYGLALPLAQGARAQGAPATAFILPSQKLFLGSVDLKGRGLSLYGASPVARLQAFVPTDANLPAKPGAALAPAQMTAASVVPAQAFVPLAASTTFRGAAYDPADKGLPPSQQAVDATALTASGLLGQIKSGLIDIEKSGQNGLIGPETALQLISGTGMLGHDEADEALRLKLTSLLMDKKPGLLETAATTNETAKLSLADWYASRKDAKAVPLYEALLASAVGKSAAAPVAPPLVPPPLALSRLTHYYEAIQEYAKAGDTLSTVVSFTSIPYYASTGLVEAARLYRLAGLDDKAQALYTLVTPYKYGWGSGIMLIDLANALMDKGRQNEARSLLLTPVEGDFSEQIKVAMLAQLAVSYLRTGELDEAEKYARQTVDSAVAIELLKNEGLEAQVELAQMVSDVVPRWRKQPFTCEPQTINAAVPPADSALFNRLLDGLKKSDPAVVEQITAGGAISADALLAAGVSASAPSPVRLKISMVAPVELTAKCDDPEIKVTVSDAVSDAGLLWEKQITVVLPATLVDAKKARTVTITSPKYPNYEVKVPVSMDVAG